jgi:hypothetical protein
MTDNHQDCIRGCTKPCGCDECIAADEPQHDPTPRPAAEGLLCKRCANQLHTWLDQIVDRTAQLDPRIQRTGDNNNTRHGKISGSPSLVRLDVAALTDPRTRQPATEFTDPRSEYYDPHPPIDIPGELSTWAGALADDHQVTADHRTLTEAVDLLTGWWEALVNAPWITEFYDRMQEIQRLLNRAHRTERPRPVGHCLTMLEKNDTPTACGAPLYQDASIQGQAVAHCRKCGRTYKGLDLVRARAAEPLAG